VNLSQLLEDLIVIGREGDFQRVADLMKQSKAAVKKIIANQNEVKLFAELLPIADRIALIKSIAIAEHQLGGVGSVTTLMHLLPLVPDNERDLLDWILRNTKSYDYYSHGARSVEELDAVRARIAANKAARVSKEEARQKEAKQRIADAATASLYNAVRRGDSKAVLALLEKGANPNSHTPDGATLLEFASSKGHAAIVEVLRSAGAS